MIYVLPGMGADSNMFSGRWRELPDCTFLNWPAYGGESTITEMAESVISAAGIPDGAILVGASLGGIIACEIARLRTLRHLVLVGSATCPEEINAWLAALHPLSELAPVEWLRWSAGKIPGELSRMFSQSEPLFIRAACRAIFAWRGLDTSRISPHRIHGKNDHVIPLPAHVDRILDGGHLIAMTHPQECCEFITEVTATPRRG